MVELNFPNAVRDQKDFYGRKIEQERIEQVFRSGGRLPVVLLGERRIGKTSMLNIVLQRLSQAGGQCFIPLLVEPRGVGNFFELAKAILLRLNASMPDGGKVGALSRAGLETVGQFEDLFAQVLDGGMEDRTYLICVDEFDAVVRDTPSDEWPRIEGLVHHLIEQTRLPVRLFFTMTRLPEAIQESTSSPLVSKSLPVELGPFTPEDLQALVIGLSGDIFAWKAAGLTWLQSASGGHPYYAKLLLSHVLQAYGANPQAGDEAVFAAALSSALDDPRANQVIPNLFRVHLNAAERELLLFLAQRQAPVSYQELLQAGASWLTTARRLSRRGYLLETDQRFDFRIAFLATWLRNWASYEEECERYSSLRKFLAEPVVLEVDEVAGQIRLSGEAVRVSIQEFHIMLCLARQSGKLVDRDALILDVWKTEDGVNDQMVDTAIFRLRKKLQDHGQYIETIPGQGFTLHRAILIPSQKH